MHITAKHVRAIYECMSQLPPFSGWKLPASDRVIFKVVKSSFVMGDYEPDPHTIRVSSVLNRHFADVFETMAHEMSHLHLERAGSKDHADHDAGFKAIASKVCDKFGWKEGTF